VTKKEEAFKLFDEGKDTSSPEVKALKLKGGTRFNYYLEWQKKGGIASSSSEPIGEAKRKGRAISELEMLVKPSEK